MRHRLIEAIRIVAGDRHKLVVLLGDFGSGKTALLKDVCQAVGGAYLNANLEVSERLLALPPEAYTDGLTPSELVDDLCDQLSPDGRPVFVDNVELLLSSEVGGLNIVDTLARAARQRPVVLALPARLQGGYAQYSIMGRRDHMLMPVDEYIVLEMK